MATSSRTSVALPETFSDGDIVLWLRKFELCSTANDWKDTNMLKRLPTLLSGKAFAVFERLAAEAKEDYKTFTKALTTAFGGDTTGKHLAMMAFSSQSNEKARRRYTSVRLQFRGTVKARNAKNRK
jgi:hypothetical protein